MNTKIIFSAIGFVSGALIGGTAALIISKKSYEKKMQEEVDKVWAEVNNIKPFKKPELDEVMKEAKIEPSTGFYNSEPQQQIATESIIKTNCYTYPDIHKTNDTIYEITENDLDEDEYDVIELVLYADGILADDGDYPVRSLSDTVGENFHEIFTPDKDEIIIRNEKKKVDYDVVRSLLSYGEMLDRHPETEQRLQYDDAMEKYYAEDADDEDGEDEEE